MASLVLENVPTTLLKRLERRAEQLGITPSDEALRLLHASLMEVEAHREEGELLEDRSGLLVFTGRLDPESIPSVHEVREQRIDELIRRAHEGGD